MQTIVSKFGGSSTAGPDQFRRILRLLRASPDRRCVVLSAPGIDAGHHEKVTSMLETCWNERKDPARLEAAVSRVVKRFDDISKALSLPDAGGMIREAIKSALGISLPHVLSRGEFLCAGLFSRFSGIPMADAAELIAFDESGVLDEERTRQGFEVLGRRMDRVVMPGFYGADPAGRIHTFSRNGSDISGALAAANLEAGLYENWTDVPGLMTADPAVVPEARLIPQISYRQMRALARAGAQVLHPDCLDPVELAGIPTRLRNTADPESFGTLIDERCDRTIPCIAGRRDAALPDGRPAARVSVFGIPCMRVKEASAALKPLDVACHREQTDVYVFPDQYRDAVRHLHRRLIE